MFLVAAVEPWLVAWLTPLWLIAAGLALGLGVLLLAWGCLFVVARPLAKEIPSIIGEGVLFPLLVIVALLSIFGVVGAFFAPNPQGMLESVVRLPFGGTRPLVTAIIPAGTDVEENEAVRHPVEVGFRGDELKQMDIRSNEMVLVSDGATEEEAISPPVEINPIDGFQWKRQSSVGTPFEGEFVKRFYVMNLSPNDAEVTFEITTGPAFPEAKIIPLTALCVIAVFGLYVVQAVFFPKVSAIALATTKSELAQPLFQIILILGIFLILLFVVLPYNTFGEDIKMFKITGLTSIMILSIVQGVWAASNSISDEVDGRTALTVMSKPISRAQFIMGKFSGILWTVMLMFVVLGVWLLIWVAYKPIYDAREMGAEVPTWDYTLAEVVKTVPGIVLAFLEVIVMVAISVAISTRLPMMANFAICFTIYLLGHLIPLIAMSDVQFAPVVFIGQLIATVLPVLDHFNIQAAVAQGAVVPWSYIGVSTLLCLLYSGIAMLLALILFEDRDLA
ncbi:MAG: ABC transporter permease subunit [Planctomycetales bacterium]|nr:ABC transporter permease subunit [Planctomycetales bacterium]